MNQRRKKQGASGNIRIISGKFRGRKLPVLEQDGLRPTGDRIKELLFNWLMTDIRGSRVVDCFAGSGSLGFEALSRGADFVQFMELSPAVARQLTVNLSTLDCHNAKVSCGDTLSLLQGDIEGFDVAFIDPPFAKGLIEQACEKLEHEHWLKSKAKIYVESAKEQMNYQVPDNWNLLKEKQTGNIGIRLYERR